jgi:hypothetical protein
MGLLVLLDGVELLCHTGMLSMGSYETAYSGEVERRFRPNVNT